jgi:imidazolonepropionase-like amidohydrolase
MGKAFLAAAAIAAALAACASKPATITGRVEGNSFVIGNVRVFDGAQTIERATVIVRNGLIDTLGTQVKLPTDLPLIDGSGKTLLPGLIDAHTHSLGEEQTLADALRFGVTTELNMAEGKEFAQSHRPPRGKVERTRFADLWSSGPPAIGPGPAGPPLGYEMPPVSSPEQADAWVRARIAEGSDYIKVIYEPESPLLPSVSQAVLEALVKAAHAQGKLAVVHITTLQGARDAVAAGPDGLAHPFGNAPIDAALVQDIASKHMFVVATMTAFLSTVANEKAWHDIVGDKRIAAYLTKSQLVYLTLFENVPFPAPVTVAHGTLLSVVRQLHTGGVDVIAGSDAGAPGTTHGATLHGELALLVEAGLTPGQALTAATKTPAERFGLKDRGQIKPGLRADLVLVEDDPVTDIKATRAIVRVFKNGYEVDRTVPDVPAGPPPPFAPPGVLNPPPSNPRPN